MLYKIIASEYNLIFTYSNHFVKHFSIWNSSVIKSQITFGSDAPFIPTLTFLSKWLCPADLNSLSLSLSRKWFTYIYPIRRVSQYQINTLIRQSFHKLKTIYVMYFI